MTTNDRDWLTERFDRIEDRIERSYDRADARIRALETWRAWIGGAVATVTLAVGWLITK